MSKELELFSLDGFGGWFRRTKGHAFVPAPGQKCLNCDTELHGRYCSNCGQDADTHHRSIFHLLLEAFEGLFHLDGRIWQTLPPLFFAPGKLARDLMEGRMARHVPPFRIFLVALLIFMFAAEHKSEEMRKHEGSSAAENTALVNLDLAKAQSSKVKAARDPDNVMISGLDPHAENVTVTRKKNADGTVNTTVTRNIQIFAMSDDDARFMSDMVSKSDLHPVWLKADLIKALNNPDGFFHTLFTWGHRLALLLLPIIGLSLGLLYAGKKYRRKFYLYDHLLVAMNLLSFVFLTSAFNLVLPNIVKPWSGLIVALWTLVTFFMTLRGGYGSSVFGAIVKSLILWAMTGISFALLLMGVMFISLTAA